MLCFLTKLSKLPKYQKGSFLTSEQPGKPPEEDKKNPEEQEKHQMQAAILSGDKVSNE